jgi:hypothetical protein
MSYMIEPESLSLDCAPSIRTMRKPSASESLSATSREVARKKRYLRLRCGWLTALAVLAISPIAHVDPAHMACSGGMLPPRQEGGHELCPIAHNRFGRWDNDSRGLRTGGNLPSNPSIAKDEFNRDWPRFRPAGRFVRRPLRLMVSALPARPIMALFVSCRSHRPRTIGWAA